MAIEDLTDVKPGDKYTLHGILYEVESLCRFPTITLRQLGSLAGRIHAPLGAPILEQFIKVEKETPK